MASDGMIEEIAAVINTIPPDDMMLMNWIGALKSGDYKFGYGLLRSDEDAYDAFGVLAAISVVDWTWNEKEGAWGIGGECYSPSVDMVTGWLGIPNNKETKAAGVPRFVGMLIDRITTAGDAASDHEVVAKLLEEGRIRAKATKDRFRNARDSFRGSRTIGHMAHDSYSDIRPYFARY